MYAPAPSDKPTSRFSFPGRMTLLSSCLISLSLAAGCGSQSGGHDAQPVAVEPLKLTALEEDAIQRVVTQIVEEEPYILHTEPSFDNDKPIAGAAADLLTVAARESVTTVKDDFGNLVSAAGAFLLPAADAADEASASPSSSMLRTRHPRPRPWLPDGVPANFWNTPAPVYTAEADSARNTPSPTRNDAGPAAAGSVPAAPQHSDRIVSAKRTYRLNSPEMARLYGPGLFIQSALANTVVGAPRNNEIIVSNRFQALVGGRLSSVRLYWQAGSGYSAGTGGTIRLSLYPDDASGAHLPDMKAQPLASGTYQPRLGPNDKRSLFTAIPMQHSGRALEPGKLYHLVLQNIDPRPAQNYISSNNATTYPTTSRPNRWLNTQDWSTLLAMRPLGSKNALNWRNLTEQGTTGNYFSPILQLTMTDGRSQGVGDMEGGHVDPKLIYTSTAAKPIRERFTPSSNKTVTGLSFTTAASVAGTLKWRILQGQTELATGTVEARQPNYRVGPVKPGVAVGLLQWYDIELPVGKEVRMRAGQTYDVEFQPQGRSEWKFGDHRNGASYGFTWPAAFTESQAQHRHNGAWINVYHWNYSSSRTGSNWPVVLHLAP